MTEQTPQVSQMDQAQIQQHNPNELLQPDVLQSVLQNPDAMIDSLVEGGTDRGLAIEQVEDACRTAAEKIILPEAIAAAASQAADQVTSIAQNVAEASLAGVSSIQDLYSQVSRAARTNVGAFDDVRGPMRIIEGYLHGGDRTDPAQLKGAASRLQDFAELYARNGQVLSQNSEEIRRPIFGVESELTEGVDMIRRVTQQFDTEESELRSSPLKAATALAPELIQAVSERAATTIDTHQDMCDESIKASDDVIVGTNQRVRKANEAAATVLIDATNVVRAIDSMPSTRSMVDVVDNLATVVRRIGMHDHDPQMSQHTRGQLEEAVDMFRRDLRKAQVANDELVGAHDAKTQADIQDLQASLQAIAG